MFSTPLRLYLDVDGVLLGRSGSRPVLARHAQEFITFAVLNFEVYWLSAHCQGKAKPVLDYLAPFADNHLLRKLKLIKPTRFVALRTEALEGNFYWLDPAPTQEEYEDLRRRNLSERWLAVNTRERPDDLLLATQKLSSIIENSQPPAA